LRRLRRRDRNNEGVEGVRRGKGLIFFHLKLRTLMHPEKHFCYDIQTAEYRFYCDFRCEFTFSYRSLSPEIKSGGNYTVNEATKLTVAT